MKKFFRNVFVKMLVWLLTVASFSWGMFSLSYYETLTLKSKFDITRESYWMPIVSFVLFFLFIIILFINTGYVNKKKEKKQKGKISYARDNNIIQFGEDNIVHFNTWDNIYSEIFMLTSAYLTIAYGIAVKTGFESPRLILGASIIFMALFLTLVLPMIKHQKDHSFIKATLLYDIGSGIEIIYDNICEDKNFRERLTVKTIIVFGLCIIPVLGWLLALIIVLKWKDDLACDVDDLKFASSKVKNGEYDIDITQIVDKDLYSIANDIADISESIDNVVEEKVKDEKDKMKLVLNASHDLSNPLESIIETAKMIEENANNEQVLKKHLETLKRRVERLQTLNDEIKTGNKKGKIEKELVSVTKVDVSSFLIKGLSEIEQEMKKSHLAIKLNLAKSKINVEADENLLWRAFENLIKDVFKHAKPNTNVFIKIAEKEGCGLISIINEIKEEDVVKMKLTSDEFEKKYLSDPLNKTSLNTAKELIEEQGGALKVRINNNSFEAIIMLKECE